MSCKILSQNIIEKIRGQKIGIPGSRRGDLNRMPATDCHLDDSECRGREEMPRHLNASQLPILSSDC